MGLQRHRRLRPSTFAAGSNVTYVYYHLVRETVSYQVAGAGSPPPASSAPELTYEGPPAVASATPAPVVATQLLGTAPVEIFVLLGSDARVNGIIPGASGERWAASAQSWSVSAPNAIPDPIQFYEQYQVSVGYSVVGGGTPPRPRSSPPPPWRALPPSRSRAAPRRAGSTLGAATPSRASSTARRPRRDGSVPEGTGRRPPSSPPLMRRSQGSTPTNTMPPLE